MFFFPYKWLFMGLWEDVREFFSKVLSAFSPSVPELDPPAELVPTLANGRPDEAAIAQDLLGHMPDWDVMDRREFLATARDELVKFHHTFGMAIRNQYGLWKFPWEKQIEDRGTPIDISPDHPDAVSERIIEKLWDMASEPGTREALVRE